MEKFVRIQQPWQTFILNNPEIPEARYNETRLYFADPGFFSFFTFKLREGSPTRVLSRAILLACLGLYSLVAFHIRSKMKAINIKKVLGATRMNIFVFITREILRIIIAAFVMAIPVSFYFISVWLNNLA